MDKNDLNRKKETIDKLKENISTTFNNSIVKNNDFKFGALYSPAFHNYKDPLIITSADNVGTKMKFAIMSNKHDMIGYDLAAMSINNIISTGATPLLMSNYVGVNNFDPELINTIVNGMITACRQAEVILIGGETTQIPDMYLPGDYDIVGFSVGVVERAKIVGADRIQSGDLILGLFSSGLHISGYRELKNILDEKDMKVTDRFPHTTSTISEIVMKPTRLYSDQVSKLLDKIEVHALKQVSKGLYDDIYELIPDNFDIEMYDFDMHEIYRTIMEMGNLSEDDMYSNFNCGIGMLVIVPESEFDSIELVVGEKMKIIGKIK